MKVVSITSKQKRNAFWLRRGALLTLNGDYIRLRYGFLWITVRAWPKRCFRITLQGAKQFLNNGSAVLYENQNN